MSSIFQPHLKSLRMSHQIHVNSLLLSMLYDLNLHHPEQLCNTCYVALLCNGCVGCVHVSQLKWHMCRAMYNSYYNSISQSVDYTYTTPVDNATFIIDHFLVNDAMFNKISCYKSIHDGNNLSFQSPGLLVIDIDIKCCAKNSNLGISVPKWQVAKDVPINYYRQAVDKHLNSLQIPWEAVKCKTFNALPVLFTVQSSNSSTIESLIAV